MSLTVYKDYLGYKEAVKINNLFFIVVSDLVKEGNTGNTIDTFAKRFLEIHKCTSATSNYEKFGKYCCVSVNNIAAHGVPNDKPFKKGDVVTIDMSFYTHDGYVADMCKNFVVGTPSKIQQIMLDISDSMVKDLEGALQVGDTYDSIGLLLTKYPVGISSQLRGHNVSKWKLHVKPYVNHTFSGELSVDKFTPGQCFTVEPVIKYSKGDMKLITCPKDKWSLYDPSIKEQLYQTEYMFYVLEDRIELLK
jgi:methionyl aminopeptidase